jgi:hypothetical protein
MLPTMLSTIKHLADMAAAAAELTTLATVVTEPV